MSIARFKGQLECERFTVWSFSGQHHVSSFRSAMPSESFQLAMDQLHASDDTYHLGWTTTATGLRDALQEVRAKKSIAGLEGATIMEEGLEGEGMGLGVGQTLSKEALRRIKRLKRMKEVSLGKCDCVVKKKEKRRRRRNRRKKKDDPFKLYEHVRV